MCGPAQCDDGTTLSECPVTVEASQARSMIADKTEDWLCLWVDDEFTVRTRAALMAAPCFRPDVPALPDAPNTLVKEWLVDTGCGYDLVDKSETSVKDNELQQAGEKVIFDTVGGEIPADKVIPLYVPALKQSIKPYVLDSTPNVLSVGMRCQQMGWKFVWEPYSDRPYLKDPYGHIFSLSTRGNIPYLITKSPAMALVSKSASVSAGLYGASDWTKAVPRPDRGSAGLNGGNPAGERHGASDK